MGESKRTEIQYVERLTRIEEHCKGMDGKLNALCRAVMGDGDTDKSLVARVNRHGTYLKILGAAIVAIPGIIGVVVGVLRLLK